MGVNDSPTALNKLLENRARLFFMSSPELTFNLKSFTVPGLSLGAATQPTPFRDRPLPGTKMEYDKLRISFHVDEQLTTWKFIHDWMRGLASPKSFQEYVDRPNGMEQATLTVISSKNNPLYTFTFQDVWPSALSELSFAYTIDDAIAMTATADFYILRYDGKPAS